MNAREEFFEAGREIMRGWHEEADVPAERLDPEMPLAQGDYDFVIETAERVRGTEVVRTDDWREVRRGMTDYAEEVRD